METFNNKTDIGQENAIKVGNRAPSDSAVLAWFEHQEISPFNNLVSLDFSGSIPENRIGSESKTVLTYADELGILHTQDGASVFPANDITVSGKRLHGSNTTQRYSFSDVNKLDYVHYVYVSRFFIAAPAGYSMISLEDFLDQSEISNLNIKVLNANGTDYIDVNTRRKKYKILLEPYQVPGLYRSEIPYRVVVLLDSQKPNNLRLIYDKIECDEQGNFFNQKLSYQESVNAVPYYKEIPEEAEVIDLNNRNKKQYSIKRYTKKQEEITPNTSIENGYQVFAPLKAITDNRTFEVFNWRLIAKVNSPVDTEQINYGQLLGENLEFLVRTVKVGVLYSSSRGQSHVNSNPYIFSRLQQSPFNFSKLEFINPNSSGSNTSAAYWLVDIDSDIDLSDYDILAWSPRSPVTNAQAAKLRQFVNSMGTLVLDLSSPTANVESFDQKLKVDRNQVSSSFIETNYLNVLLQAETSGGWAINVDDFEDDFGVYGSNEIVRASSVDKKTYSVFTIDSDTPDVIVEVGPSEEERKAIALHLRSVFEDSSITQGNVVATTFPLMAYCNAYYSLESPDRKINDNNGAELAQLSTGNVYSPVVEGPFKLLYNTICHGLYSKLYANRVRDYRSSLYNFVSDWRSSWVMDSEALLPEEREQYFEIAINIDEQQKVARNILLNHPSIVRFYEKEVYNLIPEILRNRFHYLQDATLGGFGDVQFYIECTNPDVEFINAEPVDKSQENIPASYSLYKVLDPTLPALAYTDVESPRLEPHPGMGPYVVLDKNISTSSVRSISNSINATNYFHAYPFDLSSLYYYFQSQEKAFTFDFSTTVTGTATVGATETYDQVECKFDDVKVVEAKNSVISNPAPPPGAPAPDRTRVDCVNFVSLAQNYAFREITDAHYDGLYPYTNDAASDLSRGWVQGRSGWYVAFIQMGVNIVNFLHGIGPGIAVDGYYGSQTANAIRAIQEKFLALADGIVDSQTKSVLARFGWRLNNILNPQAALEFHNWILDTSSSGPINRRGRPAYTDTVARELIQSWVRWSTYLPIIENGVLPADYSLITRTGNLSPRLQSARANSRDILFFEIPQDGSIEHVQKIKIDTGVNRFFKIIQYGYSSKDIRNSSFNVATIHQVDLSPQDVRGGSIIVPNTAVAGVPYPSVAPEDAAPQGVIEINLGAGMNYRDCRYFFIEIIPGKMDYPGAEKAKVYSLRRITAEGTKPTVACATSGSLYWRSYNLPPIEYDQDYSAQLQVCGQGPITYSMGGDIPAGITINSSTGVISGRTTDSGIFRFHVTAQNPSGSRLTRIFTGRVGSPRTEIQIATCRKVTKTRNFDIPVSFTVENTYSGLTPANPIFKKYDTNTIKSESHTLLSTSYSFGGHKQQYVENNVILEKTDPVVNRTISIPSSANFNTAELVREGGIVKIHLNKIKNISIESLQIDEIVPDKPVAEIDLSNIIQETLNGNTVKFTTSAAYYENSEVKVIENNLDTNYYLMNDYGHIFDSAKNRISSFDGVLRFCNEDGSPYGLVSAQQIRDSVVSNVNGVDVDYRYGYFFVRSELPENEGILYGFYDASKKAFIGKTISYFGLLQRGLSNVYIAVKALDADGNTETTEDYIGPPSGSSFVPTNLSLKMLAPLYSVKYLNSSFIRIGNLNNRASKFTTWPLPISSGSFNKSIFIPTQNNWSDWKSGYIGQNLLATYSTADINSSVGAPLFGKGTQYIAGEEPVLISERKIQTRMYPILSSLQPATSPFTVSSTLSMSIAGVVIPEVTVYTRASTQDAWNRVPSQYIRDIDCQNGIIEFTRNIVPTNPNLIRVDYVLNSKDLYLYTINGSLTPFNPMFKSSDYRFDQPIYVYLMPTNVYSVNETSRFTFNQFKEVSEYNFVDSVNLTTNSGIFNKNSFEYEPFAQLLAVVYIVNNPKNQKPNIVDLRTKGGGVRRDLTDAQLYDIDENIDSYWDVYVPSREAYPKGGYAIIRIPNEVKSNFRSSQEISAIIRSNLTAGVAFEIQDMDGNPWVEQNEEGMLDG